MRSINNKGYSYIEVLMAGTIISIFLIPVILGMHQGMQNLYFSNERYNGVILADSLLIEASNSISILDNPAELLGVSSLIPEVLNITQEEFNIRYKTDLFNYVLNVYNYSFSTGEVYYGYRFSCGNIESDYTYGINSQDVLNQNIYSDEVIIYEESRLIIIETMGYVILNNKSITINIPEYVTENINILIDLSNMETGNKDINIINLSNENINVIVYKNKELPRENIQIIYDPLNIKGGVITTVVSKNTLYEFMIEVEVYNKSNNLINKVYRPITIY